MISKNQQLMRALTTHGSKYENYLKQEIKPITPLDKIEKDYHYLKTFDSATLSESERNFLEAMLKLRENIINNYAQLKLPSLAVKPYETEEELEYKRDILQKKMKKIKDGSAKISAEVELYKTNCLISHYDELPNTVLENGPSVQSLTSGSTSASTNESTTQRKINDETIELKLRNIVNKDIPRSITINGQKYYNRRATLQYIKSEEEKIGGFLPLLPLILGGIAAAGSVAGGSATIAQAVNKKKAEDLSAAEQKRHNEAMESFARGKGHFFEPPSEGKGLKDAIKDLAKKSGLEEGSKRLLKNTLYNLADAVQYESKGNGLYLSPKSKTQKSRS